MKEFHNNILIILNCNKYKWKADLQKQFWINSKLPSDIKYFYVIGNPELKSDYVFDNSENILYVNCDDGYTSLPTKVIKSIKAINDNYSFNYIFKTDDDQMLSNDKFFSVLQVVLKNNKYDYGGRNISVKDHYSTYYTVHSELPKKLLLKEATYCNGRFYFLSNKSVDTLLKVENDINQHIIEDHAMGYYLLKNPEIKIMNIETDKYLVDMHEYINKNYFIFSECVNCPEIAKNAIESFIKYHPEYTINVFLTQLDREYLETHFKNNKMINYIILDDSMRQTYQQNGHLGTALIWSDVINKFRNTSTRCIHFDSDVIFLGDACNEIIKRFIDGNDLVGSRRCYNKNLNNRDDIRHLHDTVATYCFGFNPSKIDSFEQNQLIHMVRGTYNPLNHPILDFFDPISFNMLKNNAKVSFINNTIIGGFNEIGTKENQFTNMNSIFDVGSKLMHFSAIGSGINYLKLQKLGLKTNVPMSYVNAGIKSYSIYNYLLYDDKIENINDETIYDFLKEFKPYFKQKFSSK